MAEINWGLTGLVFDIRRFSIHDGPGIRTSVFTKGCPLNCLWCHNPEGINCRQELLYFANKCIGCGSCVAVCDQKAIVLIEPDKKIEIDRIACNLCGKCVEVCPTEALHMDSQWMTVREVYEQIEKDREFYIEQGGMTISGGDPTYQHEFNTALLQACRAAGIHTAMETSLHTTWSVLGKILPHLDLLISDFKVFDPVRHRAWTGVKQDLILDNLDRVITEWYETGRIDLLIRIPMIPGFTATDDNVAAIGKYCAARSEKIKIELLNFNPLARDKYERMYRNYPFEADQRMFTSDEIDYFRSLLQAQGVMAIK